MSLQSDALFDLDLFAPRTCQACGGSGKVFDSQIGVERMCDCRAVRLPPPDVNPDAPAGIEEADDVVRLNKQQARVWAILKDERWHTIFEIAEWCGVPPQSVSARIRDLRKDKYGGHTVARESLGGGLFRYKLQINPLVTVSVPHE